MSVGGVGGRADREPVGTGVGPQVPAGGTDAAAVEVGSDLFRAQPELAAVASGAATIEFGARGDSARALQEGLKRLGYLSGNADGVFGRRTQSALAEFQRANGLAPSGVFDQATAAALDRALQLGATRRPAGAPRPNEIVFVGMGDHAAHEIAELRRVAQGGVQGIADSRAGDDKVALQVGGRTKTYDLDAEAGVREFVKDIGLSGAKAAEVAAIIAGAGRDAKDEIALTIKAFAEAERGQRTLERLVLSGHSVGSGVWGDSNGMFDLDKLARIAGAFPNAARQVEDFLIQGCYSGQERHMDQFQSMFPNLKTAMAYTGSAPGTYSGATVHEARWERATRGRDPGALDRDLFLGTRKGENVAVWNRTDGYQSANPPRSLVQLRTAVETRQPDFDAFFRGDRNVEDTQSGPLREYYSAVQALLGSRELPAAERPRLEAARDQTIRLIFYDARIKGKFQQAHTAAIREGFAAVGLPAPDFSRLSRREALAKIAEFERALAERNPKPGAAQALLPLLTEGLRDLSPSRIPANWV